MVKSVRAFRMWRALTRIQPGMAAGFEEVEGADDVRLDEITRPCNRAIHVRFSRQVQDVRDAMLLYDSQHLRLISQIDLFENVLRMTRHRLKIRQMSGIGQAIEIDQRFDLRTADDVLDEVRPDEPGAAGDKEFHWLRETKLLSNCSPTFWLFSG